MVHFALIGAGFMGNVHAANLARHPVVSFDFAADIDEERARATADKYGARTLSVDSVFESDVDAVLIASPTDTHADLMDRAAAAGKAIYCEKPIDLDLERAKRASRAVERAGVPFMIGFNRRFDPSHVGVKQAIDAGGIGQIEIVQLTSRGPTPPSISYLKVSGGQMRDQTIHFFDLARWLTGAEVVEIFAIGDALIDPAIGEAGDVDTSLVVMRMASGALCQIDCSRRTAYGYDERLEVFGSLGMVESRRQRAGAVSLYKGRTVVEDGMHPDWFDRIEDTYRVALDTFVRVLEGEDLALPSLADGLAAQTIADAANGSLQSGLPVRLNG